MANTPCVSFFFGNTKNTFQSNLVRNLLQNFHEDRYIIQGMRLHFTFFDLMALLLFTIYYLLFTILFTSIYLEGCCANTMWRPLRGMRRFTEVNWIKIRREVLFFGCFNQQYKGGVSVPGEVAVIFTPDTKKCVKL